MGDKNLYVFGVIRGPGDKTFGATDLGGRENQVYTVNYKDLQAVSAKVPAKPYEPTEENVLNHQKVIENVMEETTIVPMSFGTAFKKEGDVIELLKQTHDQIRKVLQKISGRIELGVKVFWDEEEMIEKVAEENPSLTKTDNSYQEKVQKGREVEASLEEHCQEYIKDIHGRLKEHSVASRINENIGDDMILNAAFLVEEEEEENFDECINEVGKRYENELDFKYTGPWPPYNFVNIQLQVRE